MKNKIEIKSFSFLEIAEQECEILEDYNIDYELEAIDSLFEDGECVLFVDIHNLKESIDLLGLSTYDFETELSAYESGLNKLETSTTTEVKQDNKVEENKELINPITHKKDNSSKIKKISFYRKYSNFIGEKYSLISIIIILIFWIALLFAIYFTL